MAKRRKRSAKRPGNRNTAGLSAKSYTKLKKEAEAARKRLRAFSKRSDAGDYFIPNIEQYKLAQLIDRVEAGEPVKNIYQELRNLTASNLVSGVPFEVGETSFGYKMTYADRKILKDEIERANRVIREVRKQNKDIVDALPNEFNYNEIQSKMVNESALKHTIEGLQYYTHENMELMGMPGTGEAITKAEYLRNKAIIDRENERRLEKEKAIEKVVKGKKGFLRQQNRYDTERIDIEQLNFANFRRRAQVWDDPARVYRANLFLTHYRESLDKMAAVLDEQGLFAEVEEEFDFIRSVIDRLYNNEEAILYASEFMPNITIASVSDEILVGEQFSYVFSGWQQVAEMFL